MVVLCRLIELETLDIWKILIVLVEKNTGVNLVRIKLLNTLHILLEVVIHIWSGDIEITIAQYYEYLIIVSKLAKQLSVFRMVQTVHVWVIPYLLTAQCRVTMRFERNPVYGVLCQEITT